MIKALVTGGAGFIGSHVTDELIKKGYDVVVLDDLSGGFKENINEKATFVEGSVTDKGLVNKLFEEHKFDYVYHLAAYAAEALSHFIKKFNYENNLIGSINLINASVNHDVKCFVFTSSIAVYGKNQLPMHEDLIPIPEDPYGISKLAVELELKSCHDMFGLNYVVFRPHNVYGERQNIGDKYRNVLGIFMNQIMQNKPITIFGDGEQRRAFTHINDVAPYIAGCVKNKEAYNHIFNIGNDEHYSVNELTKEVVKYMGIDSWDINKLEARNEVKEAYSSHEKSQKILGYETKISLAEGVKKMAEWAKNKGVMKTSDFGDIEIERNLPEGWRKN